MTVFILIVGLTACEKKDVALERPTVAPTQTPVLAQETEKLPCVIAAKKGLDALSAYEENGDAEKAVTLIDAINKLVLERQNQEEADSALPSYMKKSSRVCDSVDNQKFFTGLERSKVRVEQTTSAKPEALKLSFTAQKISDGHLSEELEQQLGAAIVVNAVEFLKQLKAVHGEKYCPQGLFGNIGDYDGHLDEESADKAYQLKQKQREALSKVSDPDLQKIRSACLSNLK